MKLRLARPLGSVTLRQRVVSREIVRICFEGLARGKGGG